MMDEESHSFMAYNPSHCSTWPQVHFIQMAHTLTFYRKIFATINEDFSEEISFDTEVKIFLGFLDWPMINYS